MTTEVRPSTSDSVASADPTDSVTRYTGRAIAHMAEMDAHIDANLLRTIVKPKRELVVNIPLRRDDGSVVSFQGFRVQHNDARGPFKGGLRYHPTVTLDEARTLAHLMSLKTAVVNIPMGGGKGGIACDPKTMSLRELESVTRKFINLLGDNIGPNTDIPAPDVNTNAQIMSWIVDEYSKNRGQTWGVVTGKPLELGGSLGRDEATGRGVMLATREAARERNLKLSGAKVIFQGFGNVSSFGAQLVQKELGATVTGISTSQGAIYNPKGIDLDAAAAYYHKNRGLRGFPGEWMTNDELLVQECDVLIPGALEKAITRHNATKIRASIVVEAANDCTESDADHILAERGVMVVPDILANAGGVIVSYFECVQNQSNHYWELGRVRDELERIMVAAFANVLAVAKQRELSMRMAAYVVATERIARATMLRGI